MNDAGEKTIDELIPRVTNQNASSEKNKNFYVDIQKKVARYKCTWSLNVKVRDTQMDVLIFTYHYR